VWLYEGTNLYSKPSKTTVYYCEGHTNHGYYTSDSEYFYTCDKYTKVPAQYNSKGELIRDEYWKYEGDGWDSKTKYYICETHKKDNWVADGTVNVCLGHLKCSGHKSCPGHDFKYCVGHIEYQVERKITTADASSIYSDGWTYTVENTYLWFIKTTTVYTPKKSAPSGQTSLARKDWAGWTEDNIMLWQTMYHTDWYLQYDIGLGTFVGSECSPYEKVKIKETYKINESTTTEILMANVDFALNACGKVCYYPGDKAVTGGDSSRNKFNTPAEKVFDRNNIERGVHGLDSRYFADWVYMSTHNNTPSSYLSSSITSNGYAVTANTKAGTPIVNYSDSNNVRTGILLGTYTDGGKTFVVYVGMDVGSKTGGGWVTIIQEPIANWKYSSATQS
jgi:hypothetical protein